MTDSTPQLPAVIPHEPAGTLPSSAGAMFAVPTAIDGLGPSAIFAWREFLFAQVRNLHTRSTRRPIPKGTTILR
jgi:hypothetical protein